jgi:hypothetical protein
MEADSIFCTKLALAFAALLPLFNQVEHGCKLDLVLHNFLTTKLALMG